MSQISAFAPMGQTVAIVTAAGANTSANATVNLFGNGTGFVFNTGATLASPPALQPNQVRIYNGGASPVFLSFNLAARTAVIPVAGTNQIEFPILPNSVEVLSGIAWSALGALTLNTQSLIVATISAGTSVPLYLTFGEGL